METKLLRVIDWDPERLLFADTHPKYHPLRSPTAYAMANRAGLVSCKISQGAHWQYRDAGLAAFHAAEAAGLMVLGYAYGSARADVFLRDFPPAAGRIPCLDFEGATAGQGTDGASPAVAIRAAEDWIRAVEAAWGRLPWFYGRQPWMAVGQPAGTLVEQCPFWGSQYASQLLIPRGVGPAVAWQYTDGSSFGPPGAPRIHEGVMPSAHGGCDMSALLIPLEELRTMAGLNSGMVCKPDVG